MVIDLTRMPVTDLDDGFVPADDMYAAEIQALVDVTGAAEWEKFYPLVAKLIAEVRRKEGCACGRVG